jgi:hypothetical protein
MVKEAAMSSELLMDESRFCEICGSEQVFSCGVVRPQSH